MKIALSLATFACASSVAFGQTPRLVISHSNSYFRTQSNAVSLVRVSSSSPGAFSLVLTPDANFTITRINTPSSWSCNVAQLTCSRANNGLAAFEILQLIGTVSASAPSTITNQATMTGTGIATSLLASDTVPTYRPSRIYQWGANNFGQLSNLPVTAGFTVLAQGFRQVEGLTSDGTIVEWGSQSDTVPPPSGNGFLALACGNTHCVTLSGDGHVFTWGTDTAGQLDGGPTGNGFVAVAAYQAGSVALTNDGHIVQWGVVDATDFPTGGGFVSIAAGYAHGLALAPNGVITQWGATSNSQRVNLPPGGGWTAIASTNYNGIARRVDGTLFEWGSTVNNVTSGLYSGVATSFGGTAENSAVWAMPADGSIVIWGDAFSVYTKNKPTTGGYAQNSVAFGLNGANVLAPLADPTANGGGGQSTLVNTAFATPLSIKLLDATGSAAAGITITFTAPGSGASGTFSNSSTSISVTTDSTGVASTTFTANGTAGSYSVNASYTGLTSVPFALTNQAPLALISINQGDNTPIPTGVLYSPGVGFLLITFNQTPTNLTDTANYLLVSRADGSDPQTASCASLAPGDSNAGISTAFDNGGNGVLVNFATFPAAMRFKLLVCASNRVNAANSLTGAAGTKLSSDSSSKSFGTLPILAVTGVTQNSAGGATIAEGAAVNSQVTALYANLNSAPVAASVTSSRVKLSSGTPTTSGCANPNPTVSGAVSISGNAIVFTPTTALFTPGVYQLVVCGTVQGGNGALLGSSGVGSGGVDFIRNFTIAQVATALSKTAGDGQSAVVSTAFAANLKMTVTDQAGAPMGGVPVTFSAVPGAGGASAAFTSGAPVNTVSNGTATASTLTANTVAGGFTVTATAGSLSQTFNLTNLGLQGVTITVPAGISFTLNGVNYTGTQTVSLAPGSYGLSTPATQLLSAGTQAVFTGWSDSGAISHNITVASSPLSITGSFKTQYQLTVTTPTFGAITPGSGNFYDAGSVVNVIATPNPGLYFNGWTGPVADPTSAATTITMSAPVTIAASFAVPASPVITWNNPADILFGSALSAVQLNATASVPGTFLYSLPIGTVLPIGASQPLFVVFEPADMVHYQPAMKTVVINVTSNPVAGVNLVTTYGLSRDPATQDVLVQITVADAGSTTATGVRMNAMKIGTTAASTALPVALGDLAYGQTAQTTVRVPSPGAHGAASTLTFTGQSSAGTFGGTFRIALP